MHTILIIDDDPDDIEITKRILTRIDPNVKVETALSGKAALESLCNLENLPSLILLDLKMPGLSGFDLLQNIRADGRMQHIPVIVVTSSDLEADEKAAYESGADGFLQKAFDIDLFGREIKAVLERWLKIEHKRNILW
ncbi:MAG: response regulator [Thermodesulfovibrionales bacterium]